MSKEELNVFRKSFCTSARNRDGTLSVYKSSSMNSIWEPPLIVSFARSVPLNKPFSTLSEPAFTEATKALEHLQKSSEIKATLPAYRAHKKRSDTSFQWTDSKKLFDSGELWRAKSKIKIPQNYRGRPSFSSVFVFVCLFVCLCFFWSTGTRDSTPANANNSVLAKNPSRS